MRMPPTSRKAARSKVFLASVAVVAVLALGACSAGDFIPFQLPFLVTPTFTPTPIPTPTPTPPPTATPRPGETPIPPTPTPVPTPQVTIPQGFAPVVDEERGYSLAVPPGWALLDLRGAQFQQMAATFGLADQLGPLNDFLASPEGEMMGVLYWTDLMNAMFGGLPTALNVFVIDAPGATPDSLLQTIQGFLESQSSMLGDVEIRDLNSATINNMPGVRASAIADLSSVGMNARLFVKVAALLGNDKIYILTLVTQADQQAAKEPQFDQIIGTFRPE